MGKNLESKNKEKPAAQQAENVSTIDPSLPTIPSSTTTAAQPASYPVGYAPTTNFYSLPHSETPEEAQERNKRWWRNLYESAHNVPEDSMTPMSNPPAPPPAPPLSANSYSYDPITHHQRGMMGYNASATLTSPYDNRLRPQSSISQYPTTGAQEYFPAPTAQGPYYDNSGSYPDPNFLAPTAQGPYYDNSRAYPDPNFLVPTAQGLHDNSPSTYLAPSYFDGAFQDLCHWNCEMEDGMLAAVIDFLLCFC